MQRHSYYSFDSSLFIHLLDGDVVIGDRGCLIRDELQVNAESEIPTFMKGASQLNPCGVDKTRRIASVRIQVGRVIGLHQ